MPVMDDSRHKPTILVVGGNGRVGSELTGLLAHRGARVLVASRRPEQATQRPGVEAVYLDLADPSTLAPVAAGTDAVFLLWPFLHAGTDARAGAERVAQILSRSTTKVVYLSSQAAEVQPESLWAVVEQVIQAAHPNWTVLRPTGFATNALMWAEQIRNGDVVRWPYGEVARPLIHERDIAAVAAAALLEEQDMHRHIVISGPELMTQMQQVEAIGAAIGRRLRWEEVDRSVAEHEWGLPRMMLETWHSFLDRPEPVTEEVRRITGRAALGFAAWASDHGPEFRRDAPSRPNHGSR
jgi:uncharacterized protein YbjT (DUF2867 family)